MYHSSNTLHVLEDSIIVCIRALMYSTVYMGESIQKVKSKA